MNIHNKKILEYIESEIVATTSDIAKLLKISWNTAEKYLLELLVDGNLIRKKREGVNLWIRKSEKKDKEIKKEENKKEINYV